MHHETTSPREHCLQRSFATAILMMGTNPTEVDHLVKSFNLVEEVLRAVGVIVCATLLDTNTMRLGKPLEVTLGLNSLASRQ